MKIDLDLISTALDSVLEENGVANFGAVPLRKLAEHWESVHLRSSDMVAGIETLFQQGRLDLETRRDGLWVRRKSPRTASNGTYDKVRASVRELILSFSLARVRAVRRRSDGYCGVDRRQSQRPA